MSRSASLFALLLLACGDDAPSTDAGTDTAVPDTALVDSGSLVSPVAAAALPDFSPCPEGWRSIAHEILTDVQVCEPWPESGWAEDCAAHEAHFPGEPGCTRIGSSCPADGWPVGLPASDVVYVSADAAAGGDGSRGAPFAVVQEGVDAAADGGIVALRTGAYDGRVSIARPVLLVGACAEGVVLTRAAAASSTGIVSINGTSGVEVRDLMLRSDRDHTLFSIGSDVKMVSVVFDGAGILISGGEIIVERASVRGYDDLTFAPVNVSGATTMTLSRVSVVDVAATAVSLTSIDSLTASDVVIRRAGAAGMQIGADQARIARVVVEDVIEGGLLVDAMAEVEDVVLRRVSRDRDATAIGLFSPEPQSLDRIRIEEVDDVGLTLGQAAGSARDVVIIGPRVLTAGGRGRGVELAGGSVVEIERLAIGRTSDLAILAHGAGTAVTLTDLTVDDVAPASEGNFGRCLHGQVGATVSVTRAAFSRCREAAVTASYAGSVVLRDTTIDRTLPLPCELGCDSPRAGIGIVALSMGGRIDAERFVISQAALAGVQLVEGGEVDLRDGTIEMNPVGINVQVDGYDLSRLMQQVVFRDNGVNLDSTELPVPAAMTSTSTP